MLIKRLYGNGFCSDREVESLKYLVCMQSHRCVCMCVSDMHAEEPTLPFMGYCEDFRAHNSALVLSVSVQDLFALIGLS